MKTGIKFIFCTVILLAAVSVSAQPCTNCISIDSVEVHPGDHFGVKVRLNGNINSFSALSVPIRYDNAVLTLDSVSYIGSIKPAAFDDITEINSGDKIVTINYLAPIAEYPLQTISATDGIIAEMFFTVDPGAGPQTIELDTALIATSMSFNSETIFHMKEVVLAGDNGTDAFYPDVSGGEIVVKIPTAVTEADNDLLPQTFSLGQNYPNPFNPSTTIEFALPRDSHVSLEIFNVLGQKVNTLADDDFSAGVHKIEFNASTMPSGIYFYRLTHDSGSSTKKMALVK